MAETTTVESGVQVVVLVSAQASSVRRPLRGLP